MHLSWGTVRGGEGWPGATKPRTSAVLRRLPAVFKADHLPYGFGTSLCHRFPNFEIFDAAKLITGENAPSPSALDVFCALFVLGIEWLLLVSFLQAFAFHVSLTVGFMAQWGSPFLEHFLFKSAFGSAQTPPLCFLIHLPNCGFNSGRSHLCICSSSDDKVQPGWAPMEGFCPRVLPP